MHEISVSHGTYDFIYRIPRIIYSAIINIVIDTTLKTFSLTENSLLFLKRMDIKKNYIKESKKIRKQLQCRCIIFFLLSLAFMFLFWYFVSCFCAVYSNTQFILIKDTLTSFGLSMLYPFGLNLLPGLFRIQALKAKTKKFLYTISKIIQLL